MFLGLGEEQYCLGLYIMIPDQLQAVDAILSAATHLLHHLTFEVSTAAELAALAARLNLSDVEFTLGTSNDGLDMSDSLWFNDPDGNSIEIAVASDDLLLPSATITSPRTT